MAGGVPSPGSPGRAVLVTSWMIAAFETRRSDAAR
jgi:hypothetical protein